LHSFCSGKKVVGIVNEFMGDAAAGMLFVRRLSVQDLPGVLV
jgi:hypothetical protein